MKIAVLGAGMVGRAIAEDLASGFDVTSFDNSAASLATLHKRNASVHTKQVNLLETQDFRSMLAPFGLVITAVPGFMGFEVLKRVIAAGKDVVDISFSPEDTLQLDALAKENQVTAIVDCGVAPGMSNWVLGYYNDRMEIEDFECYVGGLPKIRKKPFEYKAPFSPIDVIEEYTRPARYVENSHLVIRPALSDVELMDFEGVGTLEAFNTDGLRSILTTMKHIPNMKEKTLRYPGHVELIVALKQSGFFSNEKINTNGVEISPLQFSSALLFKEWKLNPGEEEFTVMKIIVTGKEKGRKKRVEYSLLDHYDLATQTTSMARTTGYTCTAAANLLLQKRFTAKGVFPPELIAGDENCFQHIIQYLRERKVDWQMKAFDD